MMPIGTGSSSFTKLSGRYSLDQVMYGLMAVSGLLLPYVAFEPAPVDFVLLLTAVIYVSYGGGIPKTALLLSLSYFIFYLLSGIDSLASGRENIDKFARYYVVEGFLITTTLLSYAIFRSFPSAKHAFLRSYAIGAVVSSVVVLTIYFLAPHIDLIYRDSLRIRLDGFFKDPNVLGPYLIFPALVLLFAKTRIGLSKFWGLGAIPVILLLVLTLSRASIGSFAVAATAVIAIRAASRVRWKTALLFLLLAALVLLLLPFLPESILQLALSLDGLQERMRLQSYDSDRLDDILHSFEVGSTQLFGLGPASYETMFDSLSPHNLFLAKLVDGGWVPAILITWFLIYPTWLALGGYRQSRDMLFLVLFGTMAAHFLNSMVVNPHHWRHLLLLCALIFANTYSAAQKS